MVMLVESEAPYGSTRKSRNHASTLASLQLTFLNGNF